MYIYIFDSNALHKLPLGLDIDRLTQIVGSSCSTYHPMMDILWRINASLFNGCVNIPDGYLDDSIGRMYIVELETYTLKWWY